MANIIIIDSDPKERREMTNFVHEMGKQHKAVSFSSVKEFQDQYFDESLLAAEEEGGESSEDPKNTEKLAGTETSSNNDDSENKIKLLGLIHMVVINSSSLHGTIKEFVEKTSSSIKKFGYKPEEKEIKYMVVKSDEDKTPKAKFSHKDVHDMISLPLDRMLFKQKVAIVLGLPEKVAPEYLFSQAIDFEIEISKLSMIEAFNDVGFAIANPVAMKPGIFGRFYFKLSSGPQIISVDAKSYISIPHPERENAFLVYFHFFAIPKPTLNLVRQHLSASGTFTSFAQPNPEEFNFNPDNIFIDEKQKSLKNIVVIDPKENVSLNVKDSLQKAINNIKVVTYPSYQDFLVANLTDKSDVYGMDISKAIDATTEDLGVEDIVIYVHSGDKNLLNIETQLSDESLVLGRVVKDFFRDGAGWKSHFGAEGAQSILDEKMSLASDGIDCSGLFYVQQPDGTVNRIQVTFEPSPPDRLKLTFSPPPSDTAQSDSISSIDLMVLDSRFTGADPDAWYKGLMEKVKASALPRKPERIPIIALFEDEQAKAVKKIGKSIVNAAVTKPFDNKQLMYNAATLLDTPFSIYTFKNINWTQPRMKVHIAKEARLREISEYGATIQYSFPINPGTILYLHEAIYKQAPDENMCCRFYHNEPDPEDKDKQLCSLLYYGINEKFLKEIRSWIRENYADKKNQNQ